MTLSPTDWRCDACLTEWTMPPEGGHLPECCSEQPAAVQVCIRGRWMHPATIVERDIPVSLDPWLVD